MYKELKKYRTDKQRPCNYAEVNANPNSNVMTATFTYQESEYVAEFGELLNDFIEHKRKPFWRKKYYHDHLTKLYIKMLNKMTITHWF